MVGHDAVAEDARLEAAGFVVQDVQVDLLQTVVKKDVPATVATLGDVMG